MKKTINLFPLLLLTAFSGLWGKLYAQCPATGPTVYGIGGFGSTLYTINPATGVGTDVNGAGTDLTVQSNALAWDPVNGKLWYASQGPDIFGRSWIYSYDLATNTNSTSYPFMNGSTVANPMSINKAAYNPADGMIYFHSNAAATAGLYRLSPANPSAGAVFLGKLSLDGVVEAGTFTSNSDIVFDALGNMTSVLGNSNNLVAFKAQYDASGVYQGLSLAGQSYTGTSITPNAMAFLPNGNYIAGLTGQTGTINSNTGVFTAHSPAGTSVTDYASCTAPSPNISSVQKTATRNCTNRTITYTITVQNTGNAHAYSVVLKDATPAGLTFTGGTMNGITLVNPAAALNGSGLPLRTPGSTVDSILMKGTTATIVLNYSYTAASDGATFSNQGFVTYAGVQTLNLPNDQIPTDDPATAATGDATAVTLCTTTPPINCPVEMYTVGSTNASSNWGQELFVLDPSGPFTVVRNYPLPYSNIAPNNVNGPGTFAIAAPNDGFAYTVSYANAAPGTAASRTIFKTNLSAIPNAAATVSTGIVLPAIIGGSYYISGSADKQGNNYFSSDNGSTLIQVTPGGTVNTIWNSANPVTLAATPAPPAGATFTQNFKDLTIDANGDYYFVEDNTRRLWQVPKGTTTAIYRGTPDLGAGNNNSVSDIVFYNGDMYYVTSGNVSNAVFGPTHIYKINLTTMTGTEVLRPASETAVFYDASSPVCSLMSLAPLNGKVLNDNNGQAGGVNGTPMAGVTVTLYAADGVTVIATTTTDADGNYHFNNIAANTTYVVGVTLPAGYQNVSSTDATPFDGKTSVSVPAGGTVTASVDFGVNQPPTVTNDTLSHQPGGTVATLSNILANDTDPNSGTLSPDSISLVTPAGATGVVVDAQGDTVGFTVPGQGTWALNSTTGAVTFTPVTGFTGDPTPINYTVTDAAGLTSNTGTIVIDYDYPPVAVNDTAGTPMNTPLNGSVSTNDTCRDGPCSYSPLSSDPPTHGTVTVNANGTYTYTPSAGFTGTDTFSYVVCNSVTPTPLCDTAQVVITVTGPPVATNDTASTPMNTPLNGNVTTNDTCRQGPCNYSPLASDPADHGTVTLNSNGTYTYTPNPGFTGTDTFSYVLCNSGPPVQCDTAQVVITVTGPPVATNDTASTPMNTPLNGNVTTNDTCRQGPCNYSPLSSDPADHGTVTLNSNGTYTYTPNPGFTGTDTFSYVVCNSGPPVQCDTAKVAITVTGPPVATNDTASTPMNTPLNGNVTTNDTCRQGPCNYSPLSSDPADHGTVTLNPNGTYTYTPNPGFTGTDTFSYVLCNSGPPVQCDTAKVAITVTGPPVATNDTASTPMNTPLNGNVTTNDTCRQGPCNYSPLASDPADHGTVTLNPNGTYTYTPNPGFTGTDTFSYVLCNSGPPVQCDTAKVAITVTGPPVAVNDTASTSMNTPLNGNVTTNDTCRQGPCNYSPLASDPADHGTLTLNPNGTYTYTPNTGFTGTDTFSYVLCNSVTPTPLCDTARVIIRIDNALPVDLLSFTAHAEADCRVLLSWTTGVERNFDRFEIRWSTDGVSFTEAGSVAARGSGNSYTYAYHNGAKGMNYFRLRLVDHDGSYNDSRIATANLGCAPARNIKVYPTIVKGRLTIDGLQQGESVRVYDMKGRLVLQAKADSPQVILNMSSLSQGSYVAIVTTLSGEPMHYKIVKQ